MKEEQVPIPEVSEEKMEVLWRCRFVRRQFAPYPSLRSIDAVAGDDEAGYRVEAPYTGQRYDPAKFELVEGGWDHEHCDVCSVRIEEGNTYWPNEDEEVGQVDLCETCYPRVMELLRAGSNTSSDTKITEKGPE